LLQIVNWSGLGGIPEEEEERGRAERSHELQRYVKNLCLEFKGLQIRPDISLFLLQSQQNVNETE